MEIIILDNKMAICVGNRNVHGNGDGGNPAESAGNPRGWGQS